MTTLHPDLPALRFAPHPCPVCETMLEEPRAIAVKGDDGVFTLALQSTVCADPNPTVARAARVVPLLEAINATPVIQRQRKAQGVVRAECITGLAFWLVALWANAAWGLSAAALVAAFLTGLVVLVVAGSSAYTLGKANARINEIAGINLPTGGL